MRPNLIRILIVVTTMVVMAFTLPHLAPASVSSNALVAPAMGVTPSPAAPRHTEASPTALMLPFQAEVATQAAGGIPTVLPSPVVQTGAQPSLEAFIRQVATGSGSSLAGVYVPEILALRIVQQPPADINYIDPDPNAATQYQLATDSGTTGLLAHNYSGGAAYAKLSEGQQVYLIESGGKVRKYQVEAVHRYQAIAPTDPYSNFIDLETNTQMDSSSVFAANFTGGDRVVFQTCIEKGGDWSWGRLFVVASPIN